MGEVLAIDDEASLGAVRTWSRWADDLEVERRAVAPEVDALQLQGVAGGMLGPWASAVTELAAAALFLRLVVDQAVAADELALDPALDRAGVARLMALARSIVSTAPGACSPYVFPLQPQHGDLDGTNDGDVREPYVFGAPGVAERGRELVIRALRDTRSSRHIGADEFQIVRMSDGRYLVVLPGVTDLSRPRLGLDAAHRTVRDLDQFAYPSSRSTSLDGNRYAQMVAEALEIRGVPVGSELVIVGHSYGADTALDLAADSGFNGDRGFRVTHVVAAGYHSGPQLEHVPSSTEVLVVQNRRDGAVIAEAIGDAHVVDAVEARGGLLGDLVDLDPIGVVWHAGESAYHGAGVAVAGIDHAIGRADDLGRLAVGAVTKDSVMLRDAAGDFITLEPGVGRPRQGQVVAVFDGGRAGVGHDPVNYIAYLSDTTDRDVTAFLSSLGAETAATGSAWSIDVSVPSPLVRGRLVRGRSSSDTR